MVRSARCLQIGLVMRKVKDTILELEEGMNREDFGLLVTQKIKEVSDELKISKPTCTVKLTREIGISTIEKFKKELWDFFIDKDLACNTSLGNSILSNITCKDNKKSVINMLNSIKNY